MTRNIIVVMLVSIMSETSQSSKNYAIPALIVLLVVASFAIGTLWQKIQTLEKSKTNTNPTIQAGTGAQPQEAAPRNHDPLKLAGELGYDTEAIATCMKDPATQALVDEDYNSGLAAGVNGTPGNIVLHNASGAKVAVPGAVPYEQMKKVIDDLLDDGKSEQSSDVTIAAISNSDHAKGAPNAPITWVEYSDLECPFCSRIHPDLSKLITEYEGKVRWVYRHFPLSQIHPDAEGLALASECVGQLDGEDAFWKFIDYVYANQ